MVEKKVSIIVPVYNAEDTLTRCVESCLNQTLENIEIILMDDCSTDSSRDIINDYVRSYPERCKAIFQKENMRQGAARNTGFQICRGQYILFVDSDDWIEPESCEKLFNAAIKSSADIAIGNYCKDFPGRESETIIVYKNATDCLQGELTKAKKNY